MSSRRLPQRSTIKEVAELAQVDRSLVSKVVNNVPELQIKPETRKRIVDAIQELDYRPSRTARNLRLSRAETLGLVVPELSNPVWAALTEAMEEQADDAGISLLVATERAGHDRVRTMVRLVEEQYLDGVIIGTPVSAAVAAELTTINAVFVNQLHTAPVHSIAFDDTYAVEVAVNELFKLGHRRIAHIAGPLSRDATRRRAQAFSSAMGKRGLQSGPVISGELTAEGGARRLEEVLAKQPETTAVVVANVVSAAGALRRCLELDIDVPRDLSMICIHDNYLAEVVYPSLTAVKMPISRLGKETVRMMVESDDATTAPFPILLRDGICLIRRESCAPPRSDTFVMPVESPVL